jgi:hypothetical protein
LRFQASPGKQFARPYLKKNPSQKKKKEKEKKIGLVEWLKVKALSSSPCTKKKKKKKKTLLPLLLLFAFPGHSCLG